MPLALAVLGTLVMAACGSQSTPAATSAAAAAATDLAGTSWVLASFAGPEGADVPAVTSGTVASLTFGADGSFSGSTGCNRIAGTYVQDGATLTITSGPMTLMACQQPVAAQETAVVAALPEVASFTIDPNLALLSADGATLLTYSPGMSSLAGSSWTATGINNGKGGVVAQAGTEKVTAEFGDDGQLSGSSGCNTYTATYSTTGDQMTLGPVASTRMACVGDAGQIEQDFYAALENVATYQIDGNSLTLRDESGATQVAFALAP